MIRTRGKGVTYGEVWFDEEPRAPEPDILVCRQRSQPWHGTQGQAFLTLLIDLAREEEALFAALGKDNRYKIRRAESKDGGACVFVDEPAAELDAFIRFYDAFAAGKGLAPINQSWLTAAAGAGRLRLSRAAQGGETRVWHAYVIFQERARLIYSASLFRVADKVLQAAIGRLNRWLHWQDMLAFKRRGFQVYDFGGLFSDETSAQAAGINRFKEEFGGTRAREFDCTVALTWKGRVYLKLLRLRQRARPMGAVA